MMPGRRQQPVELGLFERDIYLALQTRQNTMAIAAQLDAAAIAASTMARQQDERAACRRGSLR